MSRVLFVTLAVFYLVGCSNKQLYQGGQDYQKSECVRKAESEPQHIGCFNAEKKPYEEYEKEREDILKK